MIQKIAALAFMSVMSVSAFAQASDVLPPPGPQAGPERKAERPFARGEQRARPDLTAEQRALLERQRGEFQQLHERHLNERKQAGLAAPQFKNGGQRPGPGGAPVPPPGQVPPPPPAAPGA